MTAPSNANTSGLEVVAWRWKGFDGYFVVNPNQPKPFETEHLVTAASAQARIAELEAEIAGMIVERSRRSVAWQRSEARADRPAKALERQADNMAFLLNHAPIVQHWYEKFSTELADNRSALQQETQP
ncbi:hypothetical protein [uncultured Brevundimonas sp.]|uniref:hypothetical protein n=1 Tax=uncultured Brevundimonas sp. TaxID=213418 RepID=UPI0025F87832|nr:hypothetical protein [uncultured Brevundimonas sp.]